MNSKSRSQAWIRLIVAAMLVSIYAAVWFTGGTVSAAPHLFYIPIILSALALSWTESLATAVISGILMSRWLMPLTRDPLVYQTTSNWILRLFILVSISLWTSLVFRSGSGVPRRIKPRLRNLPSCTGPVSTLWLI